MTSNFIGQKVGDFKIVEPLGNGMIGAVYKATRISNLPEDRAIKIIPKESLRKNWENEIIKVLSLKLAPSVVRYYEHGWTEDENYVWISWDYIPGKSVKELIESKQLSIYLINSIVETVLAVLHACKHVGVQHGDLHAGNIIVQEPDPLIINDEIRNVWITDFGYCTASLGKEMLDDYLGLARIIRDCIEVIDFHSLDGRDKHLFRILKRTFPKFLEETDITQGDYVRNPKNLLKRYKYLSTLIVSNEKQGNKNIADYLSAEVIGHRFEEWKELFVPEFLASSTVLDRNISVITGLRGCGKTMIFRRLTALFDSHLGPSKVIGSDNFIGFYLNSRNIAEAFPWLPDELESAARNQVVHYFHLSWCLEILEWLTEERKTRDFSIKWIFDFFKRYHNEEILIANEFSIYSLRSWLNTELEKSKLHSKYSQTNIYFTDLNFLENFAKEISNNCGWIGDRPFYFFLDDYSTPLITPTMQLILNAIVFRRSSEIIFKIATESAESFVPIGLNRKKLEEKDDYILIDFGMEAILTSKEKTKTILSAILAPRINRHQLLKNKGLTIDSILGKNKNKNTTIARIIRKENDSESKILYHGIDFFCSMWSSDIREMISIFADMASLEDHFDFKASNVKGLISDFTQNTVMREAGSKYLSLLEAATNPTRKIYEDVFNDNSYGEHLVKIAKAFHEIALYELKNKTSKNLKTTPPKQARRIEITDVHNDLPQEILDFYTGIIRYGLFTRDSRGKSVRGKVVPRLYLRGLLIPYFTLTFSKRDSISMSWEDFCNFLRDPELFSRNWIKETKEEGKDGYVQQKMF